MAETPFAIGADARCAKGSAARGPAWSLSRSRGGHRSGGRTKALARPGPACPAGPCRCRDTGGSPAALHSGGVRPARLCRSFGFRDGDEPGQYFGYSARTEAHVALLQPARREAQTGEDEPTGTDGSLPPGEVGVRRTQRVYASDGEIGLSRGACPRPSQPPREPRCCCKRGTVWPQGSDHPTAPSPGWRTAFISTSPSSRWRPSRS